MTWDEFDAWSEHSVRGFAEQQVAVGLQPEAEAAAYAKKQFAELLPSGIATPLHLLRTVRAVGPAGPEPATVGHLWMRVRPLSSEVEAYLFDIELLPEVRGRGLGRATLLAAEQVAREAGATVMRLNVFGHNLVALRLYESLGYDVTSTAMSKRLDTSSTTGAGLASRVGLRDMSEREYAVFRPALEADYAANIAASGAMPPLEATRKATEDMDRLLPDGLATSGHRLWTAVDGEEPVGRLWVHLQHHPDGLHAFGYDLEISEDLRRRGYARSVIAAAERACRELGAVSVGLSVFGFNSAARALYDQCGFRVTAQTMAKLL